MLDYSRQVFSRMTLHLREKFSGIYTSQSDSTAPPKFPAVTVVQKNNAVYKRTIDCDSRENHVKVMFQVDIYSNEPKEADRIVLAENIRNEISDFMLDIGFIRTLCEPIPNVMDMSIYRISMRFEGIIGKDSLVYTE